MIYEQGKIVSIDEDIAYVEVIQQSSCQACSANKACGTKVLKSLFQTKRHYLKLPYRHLLSDVQPQIGSNVEIEIDESAVLKSSFLIYVLPLISLLFMALLFDHWFRSDLYAMLGAVLGFSSALLFARFYAFTHASNIKFQPRLSKIISDMDLTEPVHLVETFQA